jgi:Uma2 family endonuclease
MSPPGSAHQNFTGDWRGTRSQLFKRHTRTAPSGIAVEGLQGSQWYEADLAVTCVLPQPGDQGILADPTLTIEILSPTTDRKDKLVKLPRYKSPRSVHEILYVEFGKDRNDAAP